MTEAADAEGGATPGTLAGRPGAPAVERLRLVAITDHTVLGGAEMLARARRLCRLAPAGSVALQLRDRGRPLAERRRLGTELRAITRDAGQLLFVNDRLDLAWLLEADGLHLGAASVSPEAVRAGSARLGVPAPILSRAWHEPATVADVDADLVLLSPIISPRKGRPAHGLDGLRRARGALPRDARLVALGGVTAEAAAACLGAGAQAVAAIGAVWQAPLEPLLAALGLAAGPAGLAAEP